MFLVVRPICASRGKVAEDIQCIRLRLLNYYDHALVCNWFLEVLGLGHKSQPFSPSLPVFAGQCLHVLFVIRLINNFKTEQSLDDVFHSHNTFHTTEFIYHQCQMFLLDDECVEKVGDGQGSMHHDDIASQVPQILFILFVY